MKKILILVILLVAVFIFRGRLIDLAVTLFPREESQQNWIVRERSDVYTKLRGLDFNPSLQILGDFSQSLQAELRSVQSVGSKKRAHKRYVICELAVVYKKMALLYLQNDSPEKYLEFMQKSQDRLADCASAQHVVNKE